MFQLVNTEADVLFFVKASSTCRPTSFLISFQPKQREDLVKSVLLMLRVPR